MGAISDILFLVTVFAFFLTIFGGICNSSGCQTWDEYLTTQVLTNLGVQVGIVITLLGAAAAVQLLPGIGFPNPYVYFAPVFGFLFTLSFIFDDVLFGLQSQYNADSSVVLFLSFSFKLIFILKLIDWGKGQSSL